MTVSAPSRNGKRGGPRHVVTVERHALVGDLLDWQALVREALDANGYSLQTVLRLPAGPWRSEMQAAHIDIHDRLNNLLARLRTASATYDGKPAGA
jgi:hypothetical protein